jgi:hypothetical protein
MVEIEIGVLHASASTAASAIANASSPRSPPENANAIPAHAKIKWMLTTERARSKLARAYPETGKES